MPARLVIIGTGGNALDILDVVDATNRASPVWEVAGFLDDSRAAGNRFEGFPILGALKDAPAQGDCMFVNAIGSDRSFRKRPDLIATTRLKPERFAALIHPLAAVSLRAKLGPGVCVNAGVCIAGGVTIGPHVWLGAGCVIGHDVTVEDYAMVSPRVVVSGFVHIGTAAYIGAGACIRQRLTIGDRALIGLGGVVIADVAAGTTVVGNPARVMAWSPKSGRTGETPPPRPGLADTPPARPGIPGPQASADDSQSGDS